MEAITLFSEYAISTVRVRNKSVWNQYCKDRAAFLDYFLFRTRLHENATSSK